MNGRYGLFTSLPAANALCIAVLFREGKHRVIVLYLYTLVGLPCVRVAGMELRRCSPFIDIIFP